MSKSLAFSIFEGAAVEQQHDGEFELVTPPGNYKPAALATVLPLESVPQSAIGARVILDLELLSGTLGAMLTNTADGIAGVETVIDQPVRQKVVVEARGRLANALFLRSLDRGQARARARAVAVAA